MVFLSRLGPDDPNYFLWDYSCQTLVLSNKISQSPDNIKIIKLYIYIFKVLIRKHRNEGKHWHEMT